MTAHLHRLLLIALALLLVPGAASGVTLVNKSAPDHHIEQLQFKLGTRVTPFFSWEQADDTVGTPGDLGFSLKFARLTLAGKFKPVQADGAPPLYFTQQVGVELMPEPRLKDAYFHVHVYDFLQFTFGQFKVASSRTNLESGEKALFARRPRLRELVPSRDMGVSFHGFLVRRHLQWRVGAFNGEGSNRVSNINDKFLLNGSITVSPFGSDSKVMGLHRDRWAKELAQAGLPDLPMLDLSYNIVYNVIGPQGQEAATIAHVGGLFFHWRWFTVQAEGLYKITDYEDTNIADFNGWAMYANAGIFPPMVPYLQDHVIFLVRYEQWDEYMPQRLVVPLAGATDPHQAQRKFEFGVAWVASQPLFKGLAELRAQVTYAILDELEGQRYDNNLLTVSAQLTF